MFAVCNSDFLADIDLDRLREDHARSGAVATLVLAPHRPGYTDLRIDRSGRVRSLGDPTAEGSDMREDPFLFTGLQMLDEEVLDRIPSGGPSDLVREVYRPLLDEGALHACLHDGFWEDFGTPEFYLEGSLRLLAAPPELRRRIAETDPVRSMGGARVAVGPAADFHAGVEFSGGVALGLACMVAEGTRVEDSVVMAESFIGPGCELRRCIVGPAAEIPAGTHLENVLVCADLEPERSVAPPVERRAGLLFRPLNVDA